MLINAALFEDSSLETMRAPLFASHLLAYGEATLSPFPLALSSVSGRSPDPLCQEAKAVQKGVWHHATSTESLADPLSHAAGGIHEGIYLGLRGQHVQRAATATTWQDTFVEKAHEQRLLNLLIAAHDRTVIGDLL